MSVRSSSPSSPGLARGPGGARLRTLLVAAFIGFALIGPAHAVKPDEVLPDAAQEARARTLSKELRCMVCQNQSIDDSDAPLARDLRLLVRERIEAGDSDGQVMDFLVARYGEFVLLRPTWHGANAILWLAPFAVLVIGGIGVLIALRRRAGQPATAVAPLSPEEETRLREALREPGDVTKV
ncbi:cytochrome C biogenesis protein [Ancylobacter novellus DSM 506]|uniref:Cytochrome c-type biogenesis protein n=1 Tax=Ancylobacter novellus (strain ATCC 8093 / DSM 506 / JCM 20403 / CCM 1077 / IAM 12100 / NBRC 12443 / NCIMB 10456) TaxID=639283 RepID=D7A5E0_ANCN5|nr:cytochrome C biogenesis protein [Ancylobacter novellus DSM 506]